MKFELSFFKATVQHFCYYATGESLPYSLLRQGAKMYNYINHWHCSFVCTHSMGLPQGAPGGCNWPDRQGTFPYPFITWHPRRLSMLIPTGSSIFVTVMNKTQFVHDPTENDFVSNLIWQEVESISSTYVQTMNTHYTLCSVGEVQNILTVSLVGKKNGSVLDITPNFIWWWGDRSRVLKSIKYPYIAIIPSSTGNINWPWVRVLSMRQIYLSINYIY